MNLLVAEHIGDEPGDGFDRNGSIDLQRHGDPAASALNPYAVAVL